MSWSSFPSQNKCCSNVMYIHMCNTIVCEINERTAKVIWHGLVSRFLFCFWIRSGLHVRPATHYSVIENFKSRDRFRSCLNGSRIYTDMWKLFHGIGLSFGSVWHMCSADVFFDIQRKKVLWGSEVLHRLSAYFFYLHSNVSWASQKWFFFSSTTFPFRLH